MCKHQQKLPLPSEVKAQTWAYWQLFSQSFISLLNLIESVWLKNIINHYKGNKKTIRAQITGFIHILTVVSIRKLWNSRLCCLFSTTPVVQQKKKKNEDSFLPHFLWSGTEEELGLRLDPGWEVFQSGTWPNCGVPGGKRLIRRKGRNLGQNPELCKEPTNILIFWNLFLCHHMSGVKEMI